MGRVAANQAFHYADAFVRYHWKHLRRLPDDACDRCEFLPDYFGDHQRCPKASNLLVERQCHMKRPPLSQRLEPRSHAHEHGNESLHVARPSAVHTIRLNSRLERIGIPLLSIHRYYIRVSGEDHSALACAIESRTGRKQIDLCQ